MLARMLFQSWRFSIKRKFLAVVTIFLAAGLVSALLAVSIDIGDKMAKELKSYGANILVEPASNAAFYLLCLLDMNGYTLDDMQCCGK